jgi:ATP-dependent helicase/nuclease subunit A
MSENKPILDDSQRQAVFSDNPIVCLTASAGTGKTTVIVNRFMHILDRERPELENILALTFTRNAASEMRQRIKKAVEEKMAANGDLSDPYWHYIYRKIDFARISTFDSFYSDILRSFPIEAGIDPEFMILEDDEANEIMLSDLFRNMLIKLRRESDPALTYLAEQLDIRQLSDDYIFPLYRERDKLHTLYSFSGIDPDLPPIPGDDEIRAFLRKLPRLCAADSQWMNIEAALRYLRIRLKRSSEDSPEERDNINKIIQRINDVNSISKLLRRGNADMDPKDFIKTISDAARSVKPDGSSAAASLILTALSLFEELKDLSNKIKPLIEEKNAGMNDEMSFFLKNILSVYKRFEDDAGIYKRENSILDFNDLALFTRRLLYGNNNALNSLSSNVRHILVDEFQDTNQVQLDILLILAGINGSRKNGKFITSELSKDKSAPSLFIVGDEKQSIYRFRGADVTVFSDIKNLFMELKGEIINLDTNFRSSGELIAFHNRLFSQFLPKVETFSFEAAHKHAVANRSNGNTQSVEFIFREYIKKETEVKDLDKIVKDNLSYKISDEEDSKMAGLRQWEASQIARKIQKIIAEKKIVIYDKNGPRNPRYSDIAVLFNAMSSFTIYERELIANNIPYRTLRSEDFLFRPEILDIINLLWAVHQPYNDFHLAAALRCPVFGINDETLLYLKPGDDNRLWENIRNRDAVKNLETDQRNRLTRAVEIIQELIERKDLYNIEDFVAYSVDRAELREVYAGVSGFNARLINIDLFVNREVASWAAAGKTDLGELVREIEKRMQAKYRVSKRSDASGDADDPDAVGSVLVSTIHGSKGMEFPVVFVPNLGQRLNSGGRMCIDPSFGIALNFKLYEEEKHQFKEYKSHIFQILDYLDKRKEQAEIKRLLYVAATRAKDYLVFSGANWPAGNKHYLRMISSFLPGGRFYDNLPKKLQPIVKLEPDVITEKIAITQEDSLAARSRPPDLTSVKVEVNRIGAIGVDYKNRKRFIPSELPEYVSCPRLYYYRFVENYPEPEDTGTFRGFPMKGYEFGSLVHHILETYNGGDPPDAEFAFMNLSDKQKSVVRKETLRLLENYRKTKIYKSVGNAEKALKEQRFICESNGYHIEGAMDLLLMSIDETHVIDFKTDYIDESAIHRQAEYYNPQIAAYAVATSKLTANNDISCSLVFLHPGIVHTIGFDDKKIKEAEQFLKNIFEKIKRDKEWKRNPDACPCPFQALCRLNESESGEDFASRI